MALVIPLEIATQIVDCVCQEYLESGGPMSWDKVHVLLQVRGIARVFFIAVHQVFPRKFTTDKISVESATRIRGFLESTFMCPSIKFYRFVPEILPRKYLFWAERTKEMRMEIAKHGQEQLKILRHTSVEPFWKSLQTLDKPRVGPMERAIIPTYPVWPFNRMSLVYNLNTLEIGYQVIPDGCSSKFHYTIKKDISVGLGYLLASKSVPRLEHLILETPSITDIRDIANSMIQNQQHSQKRPGVKRLDIRLAAGFGDEMLGPYESSMSTHLCKVSLYSQNSKYLANFLHHFPNIEQLKLLYYEDNSYDRLYLALDDFDPPLFQHLSDLHIRGLVLRSSALFKLTLGEERSETIDLQTLRLTNIAIFPEEHAWSWFLMKWMQKFISLTRRYPNQEFSWCQNDQDDMYYCDDRSGLLDMQYWSGVQIDASEDDVRALEETFGIQHAQPWSF